MRILVDKFPSQSGECLFGMQQDKSIFGLMKMVIHYTECCFSHEECSLEQWGCPFLMELDDGSEKSEQKC